jgi:hypothetical protein
MADNPPEPFVFFSYAPEDAIWVHAFETHFRRALNIPVWNYRSEKSVTFAYFSDLNYEMKNAAVVIAFISADYYRNATSLSQLDTANSEASRRRLILCLIAIDGDGRAWLHSWLHGSQAGAPIYWDFSDHYGRPAAITPDNAHIIEKINHVAAAVGQELTERPVNVPDRWSSGSEMVSGCSPVRTMKHDIFVSYAREDRGRVMPLANKLVAEGWTVWWDRKLRAGKDIDEEILCALENARCVIVAWSNQSVKSHWVKDEAQDAMDRGILVPILLERAAPPLGFRRLQSIDLSEWRGGDSSEFEQLKSDLRGLLSPP